METKQLAARMTAAEKRELRKCVGSEGTHYLLGRALDELDAVEAERDAWENDLQQALRIGIQHMERADAAIKERDALRAGLRRHGHHLDPCPWFFSHSSGEKCTCGIIDLLRGDK